MSQETSIWLNQNTLIGFTDKRGKAWHYRAADQGSESNHYPGAIPIEDVRGRLFHWKPVEGDVTSTAITPDGVLTVKDPTRKTIIRPDTEEILGIFKQGYLIHDYDEWLLQQVGHLLDDGELSIGSAGLLKGGGLAWVSVEVPESIETPEGVVFRPNLTSATSLDGSLSTTYKRHVQNIVCDNTMSAALGESGQQAKVKHSRYSELKLLEAREALAIVHTVGDDFAAQVAELTSIKVSDQDFQRFLDTTTPVPEDEGRSKTMATNKQAILSRLWRHDERVAPWQGTAWGVIQAVNTAAHHEGIVRGASRPERNMLRAITGGVDKLDAATEATIRELVGA